MDSHQVGPVDVEAGEHVGDCFLPETIRNVRIGPQCAEALKHSSRLSESIWHRRTGRQLRRAFQCTPLPSEGGNPDLAGGELALQLGSGSLDRGRIGSDLGRRGGPHSRLDLDDIGVAEVDCVEPLNQLMLIAVGPVGSGGRARRAADMADTALAIVGVAVVGTAAASAVHEVRLGDLDPHSVRIELYADGVGDGVSVRPEMKRGRRQAGTAGSFVFSAVVSAGRSPADYTPRVIPHRAGVSIPLEDSRIRWQR